MGRRGGGREWRARGRGGGGGRGRGGHGNGWINARAAAYPEIEKTNENLETYYDDLGIVPLDEREDFWDSLRRELPNSFRFCGSKGHALAVQQRLVDRYIPQITAVKYNDEFVEPPKAIEWFPEKLAWSMTTPKQVVRKFPPFASFQKFLVSETTVGNISRQEIVSMIPPLVMGIEPGMTVLDMCAAPGSKTAQLIEAIHGGEEARVRKVVKQIAREDRREMSPDGIEIELEKDQAEVEADYSDDGRSTGLLIANDVEYRRAQMLIHQVKRLNSPNIVVTNHDATMFPSIKVVDGTNGRPSKYLKFDRILADVPCSGDGTARKNPRIWKDWTAGNALGLYIIQVKILIRALQMLKVGGRVIYSTCSMNPIENEAVVASAIDCCGGSDQVKIIDSGDALPGLERRPGLTSWPVMDKSNKWWKTWESLERARESGEPEGTERIVQGMFPPSDDQKISLQHCMRVYPHLQDTGGFFICVLEKLTEIRARPANAVPSSRTEPASSLNSKDVNASVPNDDMDTSASGGAPADLTDEDAGGITLLDAANGSKDGITLNEGANTEAHSSLKRNLEEQESLTSAKKQRLDEQNATSSRTLQGETSTLDLERKPAAVPDFQKKKSNLPHEEPFKYLDPSHPELEKIFEFYNISDRLPRDRFMVRNATGEPVKAIYYSSVLARTILQLNEGKGMKFVHCGVKMFVKQDSQGQDICRWRLQSEGLPIVEPWVGERRVVRLTKKKTLHKMLKEMFPKVSGDAWQDLGEIGERVKNMGMGCGVLRVEQSDGEDGFKERMVLPMWRSLASVNLMLPKEERKAMLLRLFNDDSELIDHSQLIKVQHNRTAQEKPGSPESPQTPELPSDTNSKEAVEGNGESGEDGESLQAVQAAIITSNGEAAES